MESSGNCPGSETSYPKIEQEVFFIDSLGWCDVTRSVLSVCLFLDKEPGGITGDLNHRERFKVALYTKGSNFIEPSSQYGDLNIL